MDRFVSHLEPSEVAAGDCIYGSLPVHLAAAVCARGARYFHLAVDLPAGRRGQELSAADLDALGARLEEYRIDARSGFGGEVSGSARPVLFNHPPDSSEGDQ